MTVQDMDICLNISTEPPVTTSRRKKGKDNDFKVNSIKGLKGQAFRRSKIGDKSSTDASTTQTVNSGRRIKQKSLSSIVAKQLNQSRTSIVKKTVRFKVDETKDMDEKPSKPVLNTDDSSSNTVVSFTKVTKENFGKTLLARKRKTLVESTEDAVSNVCSKDTGSKNKESIASSSVTDTDKSKVASKKNRIQGFEKSVYPKKKYDRDATQGARSIEKLEHNVKDSKDLQFHQKTGGKIASLFGHNPEIPRIGQRFVRPINEPVFTGTNFMDLNIHPFMISNLEQNMQITKMTTVQQKAIPYIFSGKDILIRSQTGSGKTLAYALPIVENLHKVEPKLSRNSGLKALIVVPTRELALQTYECFLKLVKSFTWIVPGYLSGGEKRKAEKARLRKGCNILVGTPGRLLDHIQRTQVLKLNDIKYFVLDEADRMLDMGYEKDISGIVSALKVSTPSERTEYDAMKMLRKNVKKVFTDDDIDRLKDNNPAEKRDSKTAANDESVKHAMDNPKVDKITPKAKQRKVYHSSSESESEGAEPFVKSKKIDKRSDFSKSINEKSNAVPQKSEEQAVQSNDSRNQSRKQTILLSATLTHAVEKLAGLTMENPIFVDAAKENLDETGGDLSEINEDLVVPQSVILSYVVTPPKLRMVTLAAYIVGKCQSDGQHKILVFMATQDMIDYHTDILASVLTKSADEDEENSEPLVDVEFFKLHGNMTQKERTDVFKTFRLAKSGVLLCTDVAARGLDMPKVDCVVQYTGPLSARDYVHRIGRTARAGSSGSAVIFLTPPEIEFVRMLESRRIRIKQDDMNDVLEKLLGPLSKHSSARLAAIALQSEFEDSVIANSKLRDKAYKAYTSWVRFYTSYPRDMREIFNRRELHLGHYAKSFALRDTPQRIGGFGKSLHKRDKTKLEHTNRLANERPDGVPQKKRKRQDGAPKMGLLKKVRMLNTSEYSSGLELAKKPKKS